MYSRLQEGTDAWRTVGIEERDRILADDPERETRRWERAFGELFDFVRTFGPIGFTWGRMFTVGNAVAERAEGQLAAERLERELLALGVEAGEARSRAGLVAASRRGRRWRVTFPAPGFGTPEVHEARAYPERDWEERVGLGDDLLAQDYLGPGSAGQLWLEQDDLLRVLELVGALSEERKDAARLRAATGGLPGVARYPLHRGEAADPVDIDWRDADRRPGLDGRHVFAPFEQHPATVDWVATARLSLAEYLSQRLGWAGLGVGLGARGLIRARWVIWSLLDVIYLQLLEHVEERLDFGIGTCTGCGGPILNTRRRGPMANVAHRGCGGAVRKRRERAARAEAASRRA